MCGNVPVLSCPEPSIRRSVLLYMRVAAPSLSMLSVSSVSQVVRALQVAMVSEEDAQTRLESEALLGVVGRAIAERLCSLSHGPPSRPGESKSPTKGADRESDLVVALGRILSSQDLDAALNAPATRNEATPSGDDATMAGLLVQVTASVCRRLASVFNWYQHLVEHLSQGNEAPAQEEGLEKTRQALIKEQVYLLFALRKLAPVLSCRGDTAHEEAASGSKISGRVANVAACQPTSKCATLVQHIMMMELDPSQPLAPPLFLATLQVGLASRAKASHA